MIKIFILALLILFVSSGYGVLIKEKLNFRYSFSGLFIGFVTYLALLQLTYYPIQIFQLNSSWIMFFSSFITLFGFVLACSKIKVLKDEYFKFQSIWYIISFIFFIIIFYHLSISMEFSDSQVYINFMTQNIDINNLNQFDFWTGKLGESTEIFYLFQGYYHFGSFLCWLINIPYTFFNIGGYVENIAVITWTLGIIYNFVFTSFVLELVNFFKVKNRLFNVIIICFMLFFFNAYYWRIGYAFYGNTYRTLIIGILFYLLYLKFHNKNDFNIWVLTLPIISGLASSSSFLFISFDLLFALTAYLFLSRDNNTIKKMSIIVSPIVIYTIAIVSTGSISIALFLLIIAMIYYGLLIFDKLDAITSAISAFISKYSKLIFFIIIPGLLVIYSFYLNLDEWYLSNYQHYFNNHAGYDMVISPFGLYSNKIEIIWALIKWTAIITLIIKYKENKFIAFMIVYVFLVFLTPLTTPAIAKLYSDFVYYRAFDILFNPFTEILYLVILYRYFKNKKVFVIAITTFTVISILLMNGPILFGYEDYSSYAHLYNEGKTINNIFKVTDEEYLLFQEIENKGIFDQNENTTIISHAEGIKTFFPNLHQIFTRRQFFDEHSRVDEQFYQIAKRHYDWIIEDEAIDYSNTCQYIREFKVDVAIINFQENFDFDLATDQCMDTILEYGKFKVKELIHE